MNHHDFVVRATTKRTAFAVLAATTLVGCSANSPQPETAASPSTAAATSTSAAPDQHHEHETPGVKLKTTSPAGDITMPGHMHAHTGMEMASPTPCDAPPTPAEQEAAVNLVDTTWANSRKYESLDTAWANGYRPVTPSGMDVVHYINPDYYFNTTLGAPALNPEQPQSLVYANTAKGAVLVATMFITAPWGDMPQPGGCLTQWHRHTDLCIARSLEVVGTAETGCPPGSAVRPTPPMLHIWFVPVPGGPTAIDAADADVVEAANKVASPPNGMA